MANYWYISQPLWNALPTWTASTSYSLGQIIRPATAFQYDNKCSYVVTTAGTSGSSEPSWNTDNNGNTSDNGMVWTNVTGQSAYAWTAPAGSFSTLNSNNDIQYRILSGDFVFIDSNSHETTVPSNNFNRESYANLPIKVYSVNASGAVPPGAADYLPGASFDMNNVNFYIDTAYYYYGITISNFSVCFLGNNGQDKIYLKDCALIQGSAQNVCVQITNSCYITLDNTQIIPYGNTTNYLIYMTYPATFEWRNTSNPTNGYYVVQYPLISNQNESSFYFKGMDLSFFTTTNTPNGLIYNYNNSTKMQFTFDNCYLGMPDYLVWQTQYKANSEYSQPVVELINCYNGGENYNNSRFTSVGWLQTETNTTLNGGATDGSTSFSHLISTSSYAGGKDSFQSMDCFPIYFNNTVIGTSQTATVQVICNRQLTTDDIRMDLDYMSNASYPQSNSVSTSQPLQAATNLPTSLSTWTTITQPSTISFASTAYQGNSYWTRTSDVLASFSGNSNPCTVFLNNSLPYSPCYMEFQNQTFSSNQVAIGVIRSDYSNSSDPRSNSINNVCAWIAENGDVITNTNGVYYLTTMTSGALIRMYWDGFGNIAFAVNNGLWNGLYNDSQVTNAVTPTLMSLMPITSYVPFIEVKNGSASSWKIASDAVNCTYSPPSGSNYIPVAANTYVAQKLSVAFTAQNIGLTKALVRVTSPILQVWVDPSVALS